MYIESNAHYDMIGDDGDGPTVSQDDYSCFIIQGGPFIYSGFRLLITPTTFSISEILTQPRHT